MDLSVAAALLSSLEGVPLPEHNCFCGEIGLSGEVRAVSRIDQRIQEESRLGFKSMYYSSYNQVKGPAKKTGLKLIPLKRIEELYGNLFV